MIQNPNEHVQKILFPIDAIKNSPKWMKQVWNKNKWDSEFITKIIDMVNSNSLRTIGSGAVRDQWGSYSFSFMSKYD